MAKCRNGEMTKWLKCLTNACFSFSFGFNYFSFPKRKQLLNFIYIISSFRHFAISCFKHALCFSFSFGFSYFSFPKRKQLLNFIYIISSFRHFVISSFRHFVISPFRVLNTPAKFHREQLLFIDESELLRFIYK